MKQDHQYKHTIKNLYATREDQQIKFSRFVSKFKLGKKQYEHFQTFAEEWLFRLSKYHQAIQCKNWLIGQSFFQLNVLCQYTSISVKLIRIMQTDTRFSPSLLRCETYYLTERFLQISYKVADTSLKGHMS